MKRMGFGPGLECKHLSVLQRALGIVLEQSGREPFGHRRLADAGIADEDRVVLASTAEDLDRPLQLVGAADERVELPQAGPLAEVHAVCPERVRRCGRFAIGADSPLGRRWISWPRQRLLRDPVRDVVQDVQTADALVAQKLCRVALGLLHHRREHVADVRFVPLRALSVQNRGLQDPAERGGLFGIPIHPTTMSLDRLIEVGAERAAQRRQIRATRGENSFAVRIVREDVQQVLEREIRVSARHRFAERDGEHDFQSG
jgi:hypothetical protein